MRAEEGIRRGGLLPNFVIAGVPKSGTSSLHSWLADHSDALGSTPKETFFLVDPGTHMYDPKRHVAGGPDGYRRWFPWPEGQTETPRVVLEATPSYIYSRTALHHLADMPTRPRVLFVLRDPATQIFSLFRYFKQNWNWIPSDMSFATYLAAVRAGGHDFGGNELARNALSNAVYVDHLEPWRERLGEDRISVRLYDDLVADQRSFIQSVAAWLGLDPDFYQDYGFPRQNETYAVRSTTLQSVNVRLRALLPEGAVYRTLRSLYRSVNTTAPTGPDAAERRLIEGLRDEFSSANMRLADAFGLDLSGWLPTAGADRSRSLSG